MKLASDGTGRGRIGFAGTDAIHFFVWEHTDVQVHVAGVVDSDVDPRMRERATKRNKEINCTLSCHGQLSLPSLIRRLVPHEGTETGLLSLAHESNELTMIAIVRKMVLTAPERPVNRQVVAF